MPIVVALVVLVAVIYGAFWSFHAISAALGLTSAIIAAVIALAIVIALVVYFWRRYKETAPNARNGDWNYALKHDWGGIRLASEKRLCEVQLANDRGSYIFADLKAARIEPAASGALQLALDVKDAKHPTWLLPMQDKREAHQWGRIMQKAVDQKL